MNYEAERTTLKSHCDFSKLMYLSEYFSLAPKLQVLTYLPWDSTVVVLQGMKADPILAGTQKTTIMCISQLS